MLFRSVFVAGVDKQGRVKLEWKDKPEGAKKDLKVEKTESPVSTGDDAEDVVGE